MDKYVLYEIIGIAGAIAVISFYFGKPEIASAVVGGLFGFLADKVPDAVLSLQAESIESEDGA